MFKTGAYGYLSDYLWWYVVVASLFVHTWCFFRLCRPDRHPRLRQIAGNALITLCLLSVVALGSETYLRFVSIEMDAYGASLTAQRWHKAYARLNSQNCRDYEWSETKPEGVRRVAFIGDSVTYGWGIKRSEDRFTNLIQSRLDARSPGAVEVMNVAWPSWDTDAHIEAIESVIPPYHVDEVVLFYFPNDIITLFPTIDGEDTRSLSKQYLIDTDSSFLMDYLYHRFMTRGYRVVQLYCDRIADAYADPAIWARQESRLDRFIAVCREHGISVRVALLPFLRVWDDRFDGPAIQNKLSTFFRSRGVDVVDLFPATAGHAPEERVVNAMDAHPNELAHRLFGDAIWKAFYVNDKMQ